MLALDVRGVLYVEDYSGFEMLPVWAGRLAHRAEQLLMTEVMWKPAVFQTREQGLGSPGVRARDHFEAIRLVRDDIPGLQLIDGDAHPEIQNTAVTGVGLQRLRWQRYEIESYLVHPASLARFVQTIFGTDDSVPHVDGMLAHWRDQFPPAVVREPLGDHEFLNVTKARTRLLPPMLEAAGLGDLPYTRYCEIAAVMLQEEIHPEVTEKLDQICRAFGVEP